MSEANNMTLTPQANTEALDLRPSPRALELEQALVDFMHSHIFPAEHEYEAYRRDAGPDDLDTATPGPPFGSPSSSYPTPAAERPNT